MRYIRYILTDNVFKTTEVSIIIFNNIPTLFILGAGASKPYGYPTGAELSRYVYHDNKRINCPILGTGYLL